MNTSSSPVPVVGTVSVGNLPASQPVTGTVSMGNFPASQNVNVTGGSVRAAQKVSTVIKGTGFHAVDFAEGDTFNLGASGFNVIGIAIDDGLGEQDAWRLNIFGVHNGVIKIASASGNYFIALAQPVAASAISAPMLEPRWLLLVTEVTGYSTQ